jgi:hypothetical protein
MSSDRRGDSLANLCAPLGRAASYGADAPVRCVATRWGLVRERRHLAAARATKEHEGVRA